MAQIEHGIRNILKYSSFYNLFQWSIGAPKAKKQIIQQFARPEPHMTLLDIGCGPGNIIKYLPQSIKYYGIDNNLNYIKFASEKFKQHTFICDDINNSKLFVDLPKFDLILAIGILHHLDDEGVLNLIDFAAKSTKANGKLITLDGCFTNTQSKLSRLLLKRDRGQNIREESEYKHLAEKKFSQVQTTISHNMLRIPYTFIIMECSIPLN